MNKQHCTFITGLLAITLLLCNCGSQQHPQETARLNRAFLKQTQSLAHISKFIVLQIKARANSNPAAKIYYNMAHALDSALYSVIDSSKAEQKINTDSLGEVLKRKYNFIVDSIKKSVSYTLFLAEDAPFVYMNNPADSIEKGDYKSFVRNAQFNHLQALQVIRACYADYSDGFDLITKMGKYITVNSNAEKTNISLYFKYNLRSGNFKPLGTLRFTASDEKPVSFSKLKFNGDTISMETAKLKAGKYLITATYHELNINGWEKDTDIEFPFQIAE